VKIFQKKKVNFKIDNPKATICIAENGYIRIMGLKSIKNSITSLETTLNNLAKQKAISEKYSIKKREIENIVVSGRIYDSIDLENVIPFLKNSMYEPDQFPGLIYRPGGKVTILLFASGKLVMVGARNINDINSEFIKIKEKLFAL
jgi:transcription initiation factor TFIID TATA-box-binding protein